MKIGQWKTHPAADLMPLIEGDEFAALCRSIRERGQEQPILLVHAPGDEGDELVLDGRNRLRACLEVGCEPEFAYWEGEDPYEYVWAHNAVRRHLEPGQRVALRLKFDEAMDELAARRKAEADKARSTAAQERGRDEKGRLVQSAARVPATGRDRSRETRGELAKRADVSPRLAQKAITVQKRDPALFEKVAAGEVGLAAAARQVARDEAIGRVRDEPMPLPGGRYRVIVADPPWPYDVRSEDGSHRGAIPYHAMTLEEISAMPVAAMAHEEGALLWLWTTNAFMEQAHQVARAWGFEVKTILTWVKDRIGTGNWLRNQTEHCLLAVRGKPVVHLEGESTILRTTAPTPKQHSRKPDEFYERVEKLCPGSKVELFARRARPGWVAWGSELEGVVRDGVREAPAPAEEVQAEVGRLAAGYPVPGADGKVSAREWGAARAAEEAARAAAVAATPAEVALQNLDSDDWMSSPAGSVAGSALTPESFARDVESTRAAAEPTADDDEGEDGVASDFAARKATEEARAAADRAMAFGSAAPAPAPKKKPWPARIAEYDRRTSRLTDGERRAVVAMTWELLAADTGRDSRPADARKADRKLLAACEGRREELEWIVREGQAIGDHREAERRKAASARRGKAGARGRR